MHLVGTCNFENDSAKEFEMKYDILLNFAMVHHKKILKTSNVEKQKIERHFLFRFCFRSM